jgi:hypothetical protein
MTCLDYLSNTREWGVTIGKCDLNFITVKEDLNFITVKEMDSIEDICGIPGTVDTPPTTKCRIRAIVSPTPENDSELYKVQEVSTIDKRAK